VKVMDAARRASVILMHYPDKMINQLTNDA
jgi:hypothetical protein